MMHKKFLIKIIFLISILFVWNECLAAVDEKYDSDDEKIGAYPVVLDSVYAPVGTVTHAALREALFSTIIPAIKHKPYGEYRLRVIFGKPRVNSDFVPVEIALGESERSKDLSLLKSIEAGICFVEQIDGIPIFYVDSDSIARQSNLLKISKDSTLLNPNTWTQTGHVDPLYARWYLDVYPDSIVLDWFYDDGLQSLSNMRQKPLTSIRKSKAYVERMSRRQQREPGVMPPKTIGNGLR